MLTKEENDLITRVEGDAPLGRMLREAYWLPAVPGEAVSAGGKPFRLRILGSDYVVFRTKQGKPGVLDEACPHRLASLALGRVEDDGVRCIYHGWKFDAEGNTIDAPNADPRVREQFCKSVKTGKYKVRESGGIIWVYLGSGAEPAFPDLPFTHLPEDQRCVTSTLVPTNFLQSVEATMDTTHLSFLHSSTMELGGGTRTNVLADTSAKLEFEEQPYGFRYAALRGIGEGKRYARINNFVMPWYSVICAPEAEGPSTVFFSVPVDDTHHRAWFVHFNVHRKLGTTVFSVSPDILNWPPLPPGPAEDNWGQNRAVMDRGHFSGFPQHLATEDYAMFMSQGPIFDRTREQLCDADGAIVRLRRILMNTIRSFDSGERAGGIDYSRIHSIGRILGEDEDWRSVA